MTKLIATEREFLKHLLELAKDKRDFAFASSSGLSVDIDEPTKQMVVALRARGLVIIEFSSGAWYDVVRVTPRGIEAIGEAEASDQMIPIMAAMEFATIEGSLEVGSVMHSLLRSFRSVIESQAKRIAILEAKS